METKAVAKYIRISPQKARLVADVVRGMKADTAVTTLRFMPKKAAQIIRKVLESAVANADQRDSVDVDSLYVKEIMVDGGPMLKRFRPRAQGRATRILKRTSHITVVVDEA
ncbi:50S ribosomal protein L22 [Desulfobulbus rhabdoformis]|jgi:large subunit ribosomal protein L22|uniref:50S ribosomal protein L22 n=1 Tax=Desulfobulbus rhabdoformis TaxID=34032 RepID=UPI0019648357|nr:50S ribosomal protein L22 [Desulfobulbus rhabdoformis]MBM9614634.1 50S ribosomal protein L22 [Desulfobulbus rhabdoformis]